MSEKYVFQGQSTFVDKPRDTVIQNFQNTYIQGDNSDGDRINVKIMKDNGLSANSGRDWPNLRTTEFVLFQASPRLQASRPEPSIGHTSTTRPSSCTTNRR